MRTIFPFKSNEIRRKLSLFHQRNSSYLISRHYHDTVMVMKNIICIFLFVTGMSCFDAKAEEKKLIPSFGFSFKLLDEDLADKYLMSLTDLKHIISQQLPKNSRRQNI